MKVPFFIVIIFAFFTGARAQHPDGDAGSFAPRGVLASISVSDLDRAIAWYGANLGFRLVKEMKFPPDVRIGFAENGKLTLELAELKSAVPFRSVQEKFAGIRDRSSLRGLYKIGFFVADLGSESERLKKNGVSFLYGPSTDEDSGNKWLIVEDPDGNLVQLVQRGGGPADAGAGGKKYTQKCSFFHGRRFLEPVFWGSRLGTWVARSNGGQVALIKAINEIAAT